MPKVRYGAIIADDVQAGIREIRKVGRKEYRREFGQIARGSTAQKVLRRMYRDPGPVKRPIRWTSDRQRRAYFATNGFGRGIPTRRTGEIQRAWHFELESDQIALVNDNPAASYVQGDDQQQMHADTGYETYQEVLADYVVEFEDDAINSWFRVVDKLERRAT
jgi:hypothetical protein